MLPGPPQRKNANATVQHLFRLACTAVQQTPACRSSMRLATVEMMEAAFFGANCLSSSPLVQQFGGGSGTNLLEKVDKGTSSGPVSTTSTKICTT